MKEFILTVLVLLSSAFFTTVVLASDIALEPDENDCHTWQEGIDSATQTALAASYASDVSAYSNASCWWKYYSQGCGSCTRNRRSGRGVIAEYWCWSGSLPELVFRRYSCEAC